ncbi:MAG: LPS-assembly protein LptD [Bacteroidetes bacterium]|nr:LPS-assembly protein LptD [Bacteroidota bacterium]
MKAAAYILFFCFLFGAAYAQEDTAKISDSTKTILLDTSKYAKSDINEVIDYSAYDSVVFDLATNKMRLYNNAEVVYKDLKLNSGVIVLDKQTQILDAVGIPVDSAGATKYIQLPLMFQGKEKYEGTKLTYSFRTSKGTISFGYSDADVGYYFGERIKKVTPEVYFIKNGRYTTSTDKVDPEYYFYSPKMKLIPKDKIIAQSVFLYIEGVPVFWIPFVVLPNRTGRSSGLIIPKYGQDATYGFYLANAGYFWAINDYTDLTLKGTAFTKGRYDFNSRFRYAKKYLYDGSIEGGYSLINSGESTDPNRVVSDQWIINWIHNQKINPTTSLSGNVTFISGKDYYQNSTNSLPDLLRQNVVSNLTFSKYWEETPFSMSLNYYRDQNLQTGDLNERLPSLSFNISETYPFRNDANVSNPKLYEYLSYSYSGSFLNNRTKVSTINNGNLVSNLGAQHRVNLNFSPTFKYFNIRPFFSYTELWYNKYTEKYLNPNDSLISLEHDAIKTVRYFNTGISVNTKLIGIFTPKLFNVTGIKHTITPSVTYNFMPDFSSPGWGYYRSYTDQYGREIKYSIFDGRVFGTAPAGETQSISFAVGNLFEMKTKTNDTTENKFQLFNFNAGVNYNFAADSLKWSEIYTDFRTQIGGLLNFAGTAYFNLYEYDQAAGTRVNKFLWSEKGKIAELTQFSINVSSAFSFGLSRGSATEKDTTAEKNGGYRSAFEEPSLNVPVSGSINYNFTENRQNPYNIIKSSNISGSLNLSPTSKWKFSFTTSYDIQNKRISAPYVTAYRDLNSWEINFNWYPIGTYRGFFFEVRIKAPSLNDIKITKQTNARGVYQ